MLNSKTFYVCSYLSEIGNTFSRLVAAINPAYKVIKDFNFSGVRFFVKLMDKNTVNKLMHIFVGQFFDFGVLAYQRNKPLYICATLGGVVDLLREVCNTPCQRLFFFIIAGSQESKLFVRELSQSVVLIQLSEQNIQFIHSLFCFVKFLSLLRQCLFRGLCVALGSCLNEIVLVIPNIREYPLQIGKDKFFDNILTDIMGGTYKIISRSVAVVATSIGVFALRRSCTTNEV